MLSSPERGFCNCEAGYFDDGVNSTCQKCHADCLTCLNSNLADNCLACKRGSQLPYFVLTNSDSASGICTRACPSPLVPDLSSFACLSCHSSCRTCSMPNAPDKCTSCPSSIQDAWFLMPELDGTLKTTNTLSEAPGNKIAGHCLLACTHNYAPVSPERSVCQPCPKLCQMCLYSGSSDSCYICGRGPGGEKAVLMPRNRS